MKEFINEIYKGYLFFLAITFLARIIYYDPNEEIKSNLLLVFVIVFISLHLLKRFYEKN